ncbi:MAG: subtilisin family serine protease [Flavobacteriaceae bacterium]|jgi:subtilisin family serine protease
MGQAKYWLSAKDTTSAKQLVNLLQPTFCSQWLGQCSYLLTSEQTESLFNSGIEITPVQQYEPASFDTGSELLGFPLEQIKAEYFIKLGLNGKGVKIGIIDGGFLKADNDKSLTHLFENDLVKEYKDYITPKMEPYSGAIGLDDNHGTEVWQLIGGVRTDKNVQYGLATASEYYLARTDHGAYEKRIEEDYLIQAMEDMYSKGVRLFNLSIGYNLGFKAPELNYRVEQMDGKTTALAKAVEHAALEKGMLIVVAAGNDAKTKWQIIDTPADAPHALTVGASKFEIWDKMDYSSIGPDFTDFVKPDISVYSTLGTSFSTPIVTGMAACIWQYDTTLTNLEIIEIFKKAGNFYPYPNNYLGYGVPTAENILKVMRDEPLVRPKTVNAKKEYRFKLNKSISYVVAFQKKDERNVMARFVYRPKKNQVKIKRYEDAQQTSVLIGSEVIEIFWK